MKVLGLRRQLRFEGIAVLSGSIWPSPGKKIAALLRRLVFGDYDFTYNATVLPATKDGLVPNEKSPRRGLSVEPARPRARLQMLTVL